MWPIHLGFPLSICCNIFSPPWLFVILHFSHDLSNWSSLSSSSTTFQNFQGISDLFYEVSEFQHHTKVHSKCNTSLVFSFQVSGEKIIILIESYFCHVNPGFNFQCTSCIICYHAAQIVEIFHILRLLLIFHNLYWGWLPRDSYPFGFSTFISIQ